MNVRFALRVADVAKRFSLNILDYGTAWRFIENVAVNGMRVTFINYKRFRVAVYVDGVNVASFNDPTAEDAFYEGIYYAFYMANDRVNCVSTIGEPYGRRFWDRIGMPKPEYLYESTFVADGNRVCHVFKLFEPRHASAYDEYMVPFEKRRPTRPGGASGVAVYFGPHVGDVSLPVTSALNAMSDAVYDRVTKQPILEDNIVVPVSAHEDPLSVDDLAAAFHDEEEFNTTDVIHFGEDWPCPPPYNGSLPLPIYTFNEQ